MKRDLITAPIAVVILTLCLGVAYPLLTTGVSQLAFPRSANGQRAYDRGRLVGSDLIGQQFSRQLTRNGKPLVDRNGNPVTVPDRRYFQTRPSSTVPPDNAAATTFSNLGPNSLATLTELKANIRAYLALEKPYDPGLTVARIPVDAVDSSASGIDPDISVANADIQAHRVATVRHLPLFRVDALITRFTGGRGLGFSGEPTVNVLELNLALDRLTGSGA
ncbi:MAG TPA: potassium-transporting ATPase subunit C [Solirubrobacteraceae bacterium]|nr:potassium-transporting ATPase subunit C [Solirubrobacteraceae bacterium]